MWKRPKRSEQRHQFFQNLRGSPTQEAMAPPKLARSLPVRQHKDRIVDKVHLNRVTLIVADTGSGKSSQVPQILLEEGFAPLLCTQPRRLAVVSISKLVAEERGCRLGEEVGYHIGQKKILTARSKMVFETAGVLLEELRCEGVKALSRYKVIILDEVHERSIESDLVLTCIKQFMLRNNKIRLVLMSATFDSIRYRDYFKDLDKGERVEIIPVANSNAQSVQFQCQVNYLEEVVDLLGKDRALLSDSQLMLMRAEKGSDIGGKTQRMITDLVIYLHENEDDLSKSMLIFLPTYKALEQQWSLLKGAGLDVKIYVLHSSIDMDHCVQAMEVSHCIRKVILATNVAESSVTIPGITYVIDSCYSLEIYWDNQRKRCIPRLVRVSRSQANQRKGRTGRTCDGQVFRMVPKDVYHSFAEYETPSTQLLSLREQVLMLSCSESKAINDPLVLFSKAMDPPNQLTVQNALEALERIEALRSSQQKGKYLPTMYGKLLASLPLSLGSAILVVKGGQLGLLREASVMAALLDASPFPIVHPFGHETQYQMYLERYYQRQASLYGETSNYSPVSILLANVHAFEFWQGVFKDKQRLERLMNYGHHLKNMESNKLISSEVGDETWCAQHHISPSALHAIAEMCATVVEKVHLFRPKFLSEFQGPPAYYSAYEFQHTCELLPDEEKLMQNIISQDNQLNADNESGSEFCSTDPFVMSGQFHSIEVIEMLRNLVGEVQREFLQGNTYTEQEEEEEESSADVTSLCRFFQRGMCLKGSACLFSHDLTAKPSLCKYFMAASGCRYGELCDFRHSRIGQSPSIISCPVEFEGDSPSLEKFLEILPSGETMGKDHYLGAVDQNILVYREEDFIFTENLAQYYKPAKIYVTPANSRQSLCTMGKTSVSDRVSQLSAAGVKILWNATNNSLYFKDVLVIPWSEIACVLWTIRKDDIDEDMAKSLMDFFSFLSITLLSQGLADITLLLTMYNNQYSKWQVERVARDCFFFLVQSMPFDTRAFGVCDHSESRGSAFDESKHVTYVFELLPPSASLHGDYFWHLQQALGA